MFNISFSIGMETLGSVDDLLDFSSDIGEEDDDEDKNRKTSPKVDPKCSDPSSFNPLDLGDPSQPLSVSLMLHFNLLWNGYEVLRKLNMLVFD